MDVARIELDARRPLRTLSDAVRELRGFLPARDDYRGLRRSWRSDVMAGLTVAIVALPLALAFGITTGLGAAAGLTTAIVAGVVTAVFGGSNVQVSGPTGAMAAVLVPIVHRYGADAVILVGVMAGVIVLLGALLRLGRYLAFVPWPVVEGFTVGIAIIIALQQLPSLLGVPPAPGENTLAVAVATVASAVGDGQVATVGVAAVVMLVMLVLPRIGRTLPASLVAVVVGTIVAEVLAPEVARIGAMPTSLPSPVLPAITTTAISAQFSAALAVSLLIGLESLLSAKVADGMEDTGRHDPDRELFGQGLGNMIAPLFGGMPSTGAIARTAVNVRSGARTRVAAITHAAVLVARAPDRGRCRGAHPAGGPRGCTRRDRCPDGGPMERPRDPALHAARRRRAGRHRRRDRPVRPHPRGRSGGRGGGHPGAPCRGPDGGGDP